MKRFPLLLLDAGCLAAILAATPKKTVVIETTHLVKNVYGYSDITPVRITLEDGIISEIVPLENQESPDYFEEVLSSNLFKTLVGKTPREALKVKLDAVSGATFSSESIIRNIRAGLKAALDSTGIKIAADSTGHTPTTDSTVLKPAADSKGLKPEPAIR